MKYIIKKLSFRLVIPFLLIMIVALISPNKVMAEIHYDLVEEIESQGKRVVAENEFLILAIDDENYSIAVGDKQQETIWLSNPVDPDEDEIATGISSDLLSSQFSITYYSRAAQEISMNSYTDSASLNQVETEIINDGIKVTYTLGEEIAGYMIPDIISSERFNSFLEEMETDVQKIVLDSYREDTEEELFYLRSGTAVFIQEEMVGYFADAGYTVEDYITDNSENNVEDAGGAVFTIPVVYTLEDEDFVAHIPVEEVVNSELFTLTNIRLLEFFGTADIESEGYAFVPDGSGALIHFNNGKTTATRYAADVYGYDESLTFMQATNRDKNLSIRMPVFGMRKDNQGFLAIIEDGEAYARINGDIAGKTDSYNKVFTEFKYLPTGSGSLDEMTGSGVLQLYQQEAYQEKFQIRYRFLEEEQSNYAGMANDYREYLQEKEMFPSEKSRDSIPFYLGLIGAINKQKTFLGIPYSGTEILTTYEQSKDIVETLIEDDILNLKVKYSGWFNGGLNHTTPNRFKKIRGLEKHLKLTEFNHFLKEYNIPVYYDVDFSYMYNDKLFSGVSTSNNGTRYLDNSMVTVLDQNLTSDTIGRENSTNISRHILNSTYYNEVIGNFTDSISDQSIQNLSLRTLTSTLSSDFSRRNFVDRQSSLNHTVEALGSLKENEINLLGQNSNAYTFNYLSDVIDIPMTSNRYVILDEAIPFYQIVLSGHIDFAGEPINLAGDYRQHLLKSIETNAGLYVEWIAESDSLLKETAYQDLFSVNASNWYQDTVDLYKEVNTELEGIQGETIIAHEKIEDEVYEVTYSNGTKIIVNYLDRAVTYNGLTIDKTDYLVIGEEG